MTIQVTVRRQRDTDDGTPGKLSATRTDGDQFECDTLELGWANNERGRSCIRAGEYAARMDESPHLGSPHHETVTRDDGTTFDLYHKVYRLEDKNGRQDCLLHNANFAGEVRLGEETQLHGCTALGNGYGELDRTDGVKARQMGILSSVLALEAFIRWTKGEDLLIAYVWPDDYNPEEASDANQT